jgi:hypothetical protein
MEKQKNRANTHSISQNNPLASFYMCRSFGFLYFSHWKSRGTFFPRFFTCGTFFYGLFPRMETNGKVVENKTAFCGKLFPRKSP